METRNKTLRIAPTLLLACTIASVAPTAAADHDATTAILGGGLGGAVGALVGRELGGRDGALWGSAIGAALGTHLASDGAGYRTGYHRRAYLAHHYGGRRAYHPQRGVRVYLDHLAYHGHHHARGHSFHGRYCRIHHR